MFYLTKINVFLENFYEKKPENNKIDYTEEDNYKTMMIAQVMPF